MEEFRMLPAASLLLMCVLPAGTPAVDEAALPDGRVVRGQLTRKGGRLLFTTAAKRPFRLDQLDHVRLKPAPVTPARAGRLYRVTLLDGRRLTGEILGLNQQHLRFRPTWGAALKIPRRIVYSITQLPGWLTFFDDDFENGLTAWKVTGKVALSGKRYVSGKHSLLLDTPGQTAQYSLAAELTSGRAGINIYDDAKAATNRWTVEAAFQTARGLKTLQVLIPGDAGHYGLTLPGVDRKAIPVRRQAGWHRLTIEFAPHRLVVSIDDQLLWVGRRGPGGALRQIRLACAAGAGKGDRRGAIWFDDFSLARMEEPLRHYRADPSQDELWLRSGDQVLGKVKRADARTIVLSGGFRARTWNWGEVRGVFLRQQRSLPRTTRGEHVKVWVRTGKGSLPDRLTGPVRDLDDRRLTLGDPVLGDLEIDRGRVRKLRWEFSGLRFELDLSEHHLGPRGRRTAGLRPARAEGKSLSWKFWLARVPASARLRLRVVHLLGSEDDEARLLRLGELRTEVLVNGEVVDYLNRHVRHSSRTPLPLTIALPRRALRVGNNVLRIRITPERKTNYYESCGIADLVIEIP
jgi:hypothetical protein